MSKVKSIQTVAADDEFDRFVVRQVGQIIARNEIANRIYERMRLWGITLELRFDAPPSRQDVAEFDANKSIVRIFIQNTLTADETVCALIHEGRHLTRHSRGKKISSFDEELRARLLEFVFRRRRRPTFAERLILRQEVREFYPELEEDE